MHENFAEGILTLNLTRDPTIKEKTPNSGRDSHRDHSHRDIPASDANEEEKIERIDIDDDAFMRFSLTKSNITDYGLSFFFEVIKDLVISKEFIETLYRVVIKIARTKLKPIHNVPEMLLPDAEGNEPNEDDKAVVQKKIEEITKQNQENEKFNDDVHRIQSKVKIAYRGLIDNANKNECALMRVNNHREPRIDDLDPNNSIESLYASGQQ